MIGVFDFDIKLRGYINENEESVYGGVDVGVDGVWFMEGEKFDRGVCGGEAVMESVKAWGGSEGE